MWRFLNQKERNSIVVCNITLIDDVFFFICAFLLALICLLSLSYILNGGQIDNSPFGLKAATTKTGRSKTR